MSNLTITLFHSNEKQKSVGIIGTGYVVSGVLKTSFSIRKNTSYNGQGYPFWINFPSQKIDDKWKMLVETPTSEAKNILNQAIQEKMQEIGILINDDPGKSSQVTNGAHMPQSQSENQPRQITKNNNTNNTQSTPSIPSGVPW